jgi:hypothetical protein
MYSVVDCMYKIPSKTAFRFGLCVHTREAVEKSWNHHQSDKNSLAGNLTAQT